MRLDKLPYLDTDTVLECSQNLIGKNSSHDRSKKVMQINYTRINKQLRRRNHQNRV